jgi:hypothetical protein
MAFSLGGGGGAAPPTTKKWKISRRDLLQHKENNFNREMCQQAGCRLGGPALHVGRDHINGA